MNSTTVAPYEFTRTWTFAAPPAKVFRAWTDPDRLGWFYNDAQPIPDEPIEVDLRVGGVWRQLMVISEKTSYFTGGVYREIVPARSSCSRGARSTAGQSSIPTAPTTARS
jgi:uncharacterized protein YndB with AHSA1/START domain